MDSIRRKNMAFAAVWCIILAVSGFAVAFTVNADSYLERYYYVTSYMIVEIAVTVLTVGLAWLWWFFATSESVRFQSIRMVISDHGTLAPIISFLPVWLVASVGHVICSTAFTRGNTGYRIYSVFILPLLYMALTYLLPPVEISGSVLPGGGIGQKVARGVLFVVLISLIVWILIYDFVG